MVSTVIVSVAEESAIDTPPWDGERRPHSHAMRGKDTAGARRVARPVLTSLRVSALAENDANSTSPSCPPTSSVPQF